ncbi:MAG: endonuclease III [Gammaproteobacteria bacterium]|nr:endonuclease III [Gammaproteobacteria bacterium]
MADAKKIARRLLEAYPDPRLALRYSKSKPLELLVAVLLSAQCTDERVNEVTRELFKKYRKAQDYANADLRTLEREIKPTGFYKNKAKTLRNCCRQLVDEFGGRVPRTVEELVRLPGVGSKTANMVLGNAFDRQAVFVDTHVLRVSNRLGLAASKNAHRVEEALMEQVPRGKWTVFCNAMILHGRETCTARKPRCCDCVLFPLCEWPEKPQC